jgi:hypothetical protein
VDYKNTSTAYLFLRFWLSSFEYFAVYKQSRLNWVGLTPITRRKARAKVVLMLEADVNTYVKHTKPRIAQQSFGQLDPSVENISMWAQASALSE